MSEDNRDRQTGFLYGLLLFVILASNLLWLAVRCGQ